MSKKERMRLFERVGLCLCGEAVPNSMLEHAALQLVESMPQEKMQELAQALEESPKARRVAARYLRGRGVPNQQIFKLL